MFSFQRVRRVKRYFEIIIQKMPTAHVDTCGKPAKFKLIFFFTKTRVLLKRKLAKLETLDGCKHFPLFVGTIRMFSVCTKILMLCKTSKRVMEFPRDEVPLQKFFSLVLIYILHREFVVSTCYGSVFRP